MVVGLIEFYFIQAKRPKLIMNENKNPCWCKTIPWSSMRSTLTWNKEKDTQVMIVGNHKRHMNLTH